MRQILAFFATILALNSAKAEFRNFRYIPNAKNSCTWNYSNASHSYYHRGTLDPDWRYRPKFIADYFVAKSDDYENIWHLIGPFDPHAPWSQRTHEFRQAFKKLIKMLETYLAGPEEGMPVAAAAAQIMTKSLEKKLLCRRYLLSEMELYAYIGHELVAKYGYGWIADENGENPLEGGTTFAKKIRANQP